jgi:hypothetical protein
MSTSAHRPGPDDNLADIGRDCRATSVPGVGLLMRAVAVLCGKPSSSGSDTDDGKPTT